MSFQSNTDIADIIRRSELLIEHIQTKGLAANDVVKSIKDAWSMVEALPLDLPEVKRTRARLLFHLSFADSRKGLFDRAIDRALESLSLFEELGIETQGIAAANAAGLAYLNKGDYARAIDIFLSNLQRAERLNNRTLICQIYKNIGRAQWCLGNNAEAIDFTRRGLALATAMSDRRVAITAYMNLGNMYASIDELVLALEHYMSGLELVEQNHFDSLNTRSQLLMNIGGVFLRMGDFDSAPEYYLRSLEIQTQLDRPVELARLYSNIGLLYKERREYTTAHSYLLHALDIYEKLHLHHEQAYVLALLSGIVLLLHDPDTALTYGMKSRDLSLRDSKRTLVLALHAVARVYIYREEYEQALEYLHTARQQYESLDSSAGVLDILTDTAEVTARQHKPTEAIHHLMSALDIADSTAAGKPVKARIQQLLAELHERTGNDKQALLHFKAARDIEKEIFSEKSEFRIQTLRILHEVQEARKETEIHRLKNEQLERDMKHLRHDVVVRALHLAQRQDLLRKTRRALAAVNRDVVPHLLYEIRDAERALDKVMLKKNTDSVDKGKKDALLKVRQKLAAVSLGVQSKLLAQVGIVLQDIDNALTDEQLWEQFAEQYRQVHGGFLEALSSAFPQLTTSELKVCSLIHINLSSKEIGRILNISSRSVDTYRYNIRQKMGVPSESNLSQYMADVAAHHRKSSD